MQVQPEAERFGGRWYDRVATDGMLPSTSVVILDHTAKPPYVHTTIHDLPLGLSVELWFVDGVLSSAVWLFCDSYLCEAYVGKA